MKYHWTTCPNCRCEISINTSESARGISGSLRRWSANRSINDGRQFEIPRAQLPAGGGFTTACVCGQMILTPAKPDAVSAERDADLRVKLSAD
jgi:hypothetical protein